MLHCHIQNNTNISHHTLCGLYVLSKNVFIRGEKKWSRRWNSLLHLGNTVDAKITLDTQHQDKKLHRIVQGKKMKMFLVWNDGVLWKHSWIVCAREQTTKPAVQQTANLPLSVPEDFCSWTQPLLPQLLWCQSSENPILSCFHEYYLGG